MAVVASHLVELVDAVRHSTETDRTVSIRGLSTRVVLDHELTGRDPDDIVHAPSGVLDFQPDEMIVRCGAGTRLDDLRAVLAEQGQTVNVAGSGTVGGALARGWSDVHRLGRGPIRDVVLEALVVNHRGRLVRAGGPTVKNVTGFDLVRVLVGSLGSLGFFGEVTLRTRPRPLESRWYVIDGVDRERLIDLQRRLFRPTSLLWNGSHLWVHLDGHPRDLDEVMEPLGAARSDPPSLPPYRWSMTPTEALSRIANVGDASVGDASVVEVGVGVVHRHLPEPPHPVPALEIHRRLDAEFNPRHSLNPHIVRFGDRNGPDHRDLAVSGQGARADHSADTP